MPKISLIALARLTVSSVLFSATAVPVYSASAVDGAPITDNAYTIDLAQPVVIGADRKVAMGGAYAAYPGGVSSLMDNPASVAVRTRAPEKLWDWDALLSSALLTGDDVDNNGATSQQYRTNRVGMVGVLAQYRSLGIGFITIDQRYDLDQPVEPHRLSLMTTELHMGAHLADGRWAVGFGLRGVQTRLAPLAHRDRVLMDLKGIGGSAGVIWRPRLGPWRLAGVYKGPIRRQRELPANGSEPYVVNGLIVPSQVSLPIEGTVGLSYEQASSPFWPGHAFIASTDVRFVAAVRDAVGIDSLIEQRQQVSGRKTTAIWHLGSELELWPKRLRLRAGTYREPSRFEGVSTRQHVTGGAQLYLLKVNVWGEKKVSLSFAIDHAPRYLNTVVTLSFWKF